MFLLVVTLSAIAVAVAAAAYAWRVARAEQLRSDARVAALAAAIDGTSDEEPNTMFARARQSGLQGRPLLKVGVGFAMAVLLIVLIAMSGDRREAVDQSGIAAPERSVHELELLSMRHVRAGDQLRVTGLVRNRGTAADSAIMAVVFVFDRDGGFVASGRAPLEFDAIAQGDESPFQVTIPDVKNVGRYQISFRTTAGILPHVDRRAVLQVSN